MMRKDKKFATIKTLLWSNKFAWKANKNAFLFVIFLSLLTSVNTYVGLSFTEYIVNSAYYLFAGSVLFRTVCVTVAVYTGIIIVFSLLILLNNNIKEKLMLDITRSFEGQLNRKLPGIRWEYYENQETFAKIFEVRQNSLQTIKDMVNSTFGYIVTVPTAAIYIYYLLQINIFVVPVYVILVIIFNLFLAGKMFAQLGRYWQEVQPYTRKQGYFFNMCGNQVSHQEYRFLRLFHFSSHLWEENFDQEFRIKLKIFKKHEITLQTARLIFNIPYILMMVYIGYEIVRGKHEIGFLLLANSLLNQIIDTCLQTQSSISNNRIKHIFIESLHEIMNLEDRKATAEICDFTMLVFNDITYTYPQSNKTALQNFNLNIKKGEKIAIVGVNGSGKTTFTNILTGLIDHYQGTLTDEGQNIDLNHIVSCIHQDFAQYQMTVRDNIALGYPQKQFSDDEILSLLDTVGLKDEIARLPNGIDTSLGQLDTGIELSKGQWQRVAIARLLAKEDAKLWILDEPTAFLDPISEIEIYNMIYDLAGDRTVLFISHRLGFAKRADRIVVFEAGKVAEEGGHDILLEANGLYAELYRTQQSWYETN